jgi:hypothetical protein
MAHFQQRQAQRSNNSKTFHAHFPLFKLMIIFKLLAVFLFLIFNTGCLSPLAMNTVGAAGSGAPVAFNNAGGGKGETYWIARYDDVIEAALRAGEVLSLVVNDKKIEADRTFLSFADLKDKKIDLIIERRTETMTSIMFDVGWSGSTTFGRLMANQIIFELQDSNAFLEDWAPKIKK